MRVSIIVARAANGVIGRDNTLPWRLPEDLKHFRALTTGHPIIMGRKTWESLGRPLPGRTNIVVSRNTAFAAEGALPAGSLQAALELATTAEGADEVFVIGGAQLYAQALEVADRLLVTELVDAFEGDTVFPALDSAVWQPRSREAHISQNGLRFAFVDYRRGAS